VAKSARMANIVSLLLIGFESATITDLCNDESLWTNQKVEKRLNCGYPKYNIIRHLCQMRPLAPMELWILFLLLGLACLLIGIVRSVKTPTADTRQFDRVQQPYSGREAPGEIVVLPNSSLPNDWNPSAVAAHLQRLGETRPDVIPYVIEEIKRRFVIRADDRTAKAMLDFLGTTLQHFNLRKQCAQVVQDLEAMSRERELRLKKIDLQVLETERDHQKVHLDIESQTVIRNLERQRDIAKLKREIAQIEDDTEKIKNSAKAAERPLTPEEQKARDRVACEDRIRALKAEKQKALEIEDETERVLRVNALDDALQREYERWAKLL